mmetsp:Transcript_15643/g.43141  ORF Transcript_15643/g.43141 Transcript_15643/m.43141 type:complete len:243 (+) Transcript_15643:168-896(+)
MLVLVVQIGIRLQLDIAFGFKGNVRNERFRRVRPRVQQFHRLPASLIDAQLHRFLAIIKEHHHRSARTDLVRLHMPTTLVRRRVVVARFVVLAKMILQISQDGPSSLDAIEQIVSLHQQSQRHGMAGLHAQGNAGRLGKGCRHCRRKARKVTTVPAHSGFSDNGPLASVVVQRHPPIVAQRQARFRVGGAKGLHHLVLVISRTNETIAKGRIQGVITLGGGVVRFLGTVAAVAGGHAWMMIG